MLQKKFKQSLTRKSDEEELLELYEQVDSGSIPTPHPIYQCQFWDGLGHDNRQFLLGAKTQFPHESTAHLEKRVFDLLERTELWHEMAILSKNSVDRILSYLPSDTAIGMTITTLSRSVQKVLEPGADSIITRLSSLENAYESGFQNLFLVAEPFFVGMDLVSLLQMAPYIEQIYVGRYNGPRQIELTRQKVTIPKVRDEVILHQFEDALRWAEDHAHGMKLLLKKQLGGKDATMQLTGYPTPIHSKKQTTLVGGENK